MINGNTLVSTSTGKVVHFGPDGCVTVDIPFATEEIVDGETHQTSKVIFHQATWGIPDQKADDIYALVTLPNGQNISVIIFHGPPDSTRVNPKDPTQFIGIKGRLFFISKDQALEKVRQAIEAANTK